MTEIDPPLPYGYTIFCDDVRREIAGKLIFIGVYGPEIKVFGVPPVKLMKLTLAVHYFEKPGEGNEPLELMVFMPGVDTPVTTVNIPPRVHEAMPADPHLGQQASINMLLEFPDLEIKQHGNIRVRMRRGDQIHRLGALKVSELTKEEAESMQIALPINPHPASPAG